VTSFSSYITNENHAPLYDIQNTPSTEIEEWEKPESISGVGSGGNGEDGAARRVASSSEPVEREAGRSGIGQRRGRRSSS